MKQNRGPKPFEGDVSYPTLGLRLEAVHQEALICKLQELGQMRPLRGWCEYLGGVALWGAGTCLSFGERPCPVLSQHTPFSVPPHGFPLHWDPLIPVISRHVFPLLDSLWWYRGYACRGSFLSIK